MCSGDTFIKPIINIFMLLFVFFWKHLTLNKIEDREWRRDKMTKSFVCRMAYLTGKVNKNANKNRFSKKKSRTKFNRNNISMQKTRKRSNQKRKIFSWALCQTKAVRISLSGPKATWWCWSLYLLCLLLRLTLLFVGIVVLSHIQKKSIHSAFCVALHFLSARWALYQFRWYYTHDVYSKTRSVCVTRKRQINTNAKWC